MMNGRERGPVAAVRVCALSARITVAECFRFNGDVIIRMIVV